MLLQKVRSGVTWGFALISAVPSSAFASTYRPIALRPVPAKSIAHSALRSNCTPVQFDGAPMYSRLEIRFASKGRKIRYLSDETLYSDSACEISVFRTTTAGTWKSRKGTVLTLKPRSVKLMPLDPRIADSMDERQACGKRWLNAEANEIVGTSCGKEKIAQYFMSRGPGRSLTLYECEGKSKADTSCSHYGMRQDKPFK